MAADKSRLGASKITAFCWKMRVMPRIVEPPPLGSPEPIGRRRVGVFVRRALRLRCPECGEHPIFVPVRRVRSLFDWVYPLDGCPRCGYAYERESGYFLLAIWAVNYGVVAAVGLALGLWLQSYTTLKLWSIVGILLVAMPLASVLFVRHAKALYLAMDHYFDPHVK
jgi:uncharacterized protein (DUF983 family)